MSDIFNPGIVQLTSHDGSVTFVPSNGEGGIVDLSAHGSGGGSLTLTDGTNTVSGTTQITVTGGTVGGTTPNATLTISGGITTTEYQEIPSGAINGSNTVFTLANTPASSSTVKFYIDGILRYQPSDYTISGNTITMVWAPASGSTSYVDYNTQGGNGPYVKRINTLTAVTSITPNSSLYDVISATCTAASGTLTINADIGSPVPFQSLLFDLQCTNTQNLSFNSGFIGGTTPLPASTTGSGDWDDFCFIRNAANTKWRYTGSATGFVS